MDYEGFKDQVIVITGAGELGGGSAVEFAKWGAKLALFDIHDGRLQETVSKLTDTGIARNKILDRVGNARKQEDMTEFINDVVKKFGKIDTLVHCVGAKRIKTLQTASQEDWDWCMDGNLNTLFITVKTCLPHIKASKGNIIAISSVSGGRPVWGALPYAVAKAGVDQFIRCVSQELAPHGVRVNCVAPGALKSRFNMRFGDIFTTEKQLETYFDVAGRSIPIGYLGEPKHVVPTIVFLASDKAKFVTGAVICVDGGYVCTSNCP